MFAFILQTLLCRVCIICITLIAKMIAAVARLLFLRPCCVRSQGRRGQTSATAAPCLCGSLSVSQPISLCRLLSPTAHSLPQHSSTSNALSHTRLRMTTQMHRQDLSLDWLTHTKHTRLLTHSGIIVVVKLERKRARRGRRKSNWDGEAEGGKRRAIAPTEVFYPRAVIKHCHVHYPVMRISHCSPVAPEATPTQDIQVHI